MELRLETVSRKEMQIVLENANSFLDVVVAFGYNYDGGAAYRQVNLKIKALGLIKPDYRRFGSSTKGRKVILLDEILIEHSTYKNSTSLKRRLINENRLENICGDCKRLPEWNDKPLVLQLEHKNGIPDDNRIENLSLLCPNCHSQTKTFAGKNVGK